jgi:hypothetical protein
MTAERVRALLMECPPPLKSIEDDASGEHALLWRAFRKGMDWFSRRSRVPVCEVQGWLYLKALDRAHYVADKWNVAGEAGVVNCLSELLFRDYPDYKHRRYEVPWAFDANIDDLGREAA